jgi:hypothetical protein
VAGWKNWTRRGSRSTDAQDGYFEGNNVQANVINRTIKSPKNFPGDEVRYEVDNRRTVAAPRRDKSNFSMPRPQLPPAHIPIQWAPTCLPGGYSKRESVADIST